MQSKTNLELKHFCKDFKKIRIVLRQIGARKETIRNQKDYYFDLSVLKSKNLARLKLRIEKDKQTLCYYERPNFSKARETKAEVSLYDVKDKDLLNFLEKSLGVLGVVEKKREIWRKDNTVFHLDKVKKVGNVFEVELQKRGKITENDEKIFKSYQNRLSPFLGKVIKGSNIDLVK